MRNLKNINQKHSKLRKNKKALSHVEMVISFMIFVGFILFLLIYIKPFKTTDQSSVMLDVAEENILNYIETELIYVPIKTNQQAQCFSINKHYTKNIAVKDINDNLLEINQVGNKINIKTSATGTGDFYKLYYSDDIQQTSFTLQNCIDAENNYTKSVTRTQKIPSFSNILNFEQQYKNNYDNLKQQLKIPKAIDFGIIIKDSENNNIIKSIIKNRPDINIFASDVRTELLYANATMQNIIINMQVW